MSDIRTLLLTPDNPCNTTITDEETKEIVYIVETQHTNVRTVTRVKDSHGKTLASLEWRDVRSDLITLGEAGSPKSLSVWMQKSRMPFKDTVYFKHQGTRYKWKGNGPGLTFELYVGDEKRRPISRFEKSKRIRDNAVSPPAETWTPGKLLLDKRAGEIQDTVVVSFLFLEKSRRARENSTMNHATSSGLPLQV